MIASTCFFFYAEISYLNISSKILYFENFNNIIIITSKKYVDSMTKMRIILFSKCKIYYTKILSTIILSNYNSLDTT